jgi:hypothetical protein
MKVQILDEAKDDLFDGFRFYERQSIGLGDYFLETLFTEIDTLRLNAGIHSKHLISPPLSRRFHTRSTPNEDEVARVRAVLVVGATRLDKRLVVLHERAPPSVILRAESRAR